MLISAGELISKSVDLYKKNYKLYLSFLLVFLIPTAVLEIAGFAMGYTSVQPGFSPTITAGYGIGYVLLGIVVALANLWISLSFIRVVAATIKGASVKSVMEEIMGVKQLFFPALLASILTGLAVIGGMILLIIPGIIFAIWFAFAVYAVVLDNKQAVDSLKTSKEMVHGRWWDVFWRLFAPGLLFGVVAVIIQWLAALILSPLANFLGFAGLFIYGIVITFVSLLIMPLSTAAPTLLYFDLKKNPVKMASATTPPEIK